MVAYSVVIQWSDEDEGYIALIPELPGVSAFGETPEEAAKEVEIAKNAMIEAYEQDGCQLPDPDKLKEFSGQLRIRIPRSLHASLHLEAKKEGISLNSHISNLLARRNESSRIEKQITSIEGLLIGRLFEQQPQGTPSTGESTEIQLTENKGITLQ